MRHFLNATLSAAIFAVFFTGDASAEGAKASLTVSATNFRADKGQAIVAVYSSKDAWLKVDRAVQVRKVKISGKKVDVTFNGLAPGAYAVSVVHDENENGKLDIRYFPYPRPEEGAGVSNDATATIGPPSWSDSTFRLTDKGGGIRIKVRY